MSSILFVCTANLYRSPLAAAAFSRKLRATGQADDWIVQSAGTWATPGRPVPTDLMLAAGGLGLDLTAHVSRVVDPALLSRHDLILVMEKGHREALNIEFSFVQGRVQLLSEVVDGMAYNIPDPMQCGQDTRLFAAEFVKYIERGYRKIWEVASAMQFLSS